MDSQIRTRKRSVGGVTAALAAALTISPFAAQSGSSSRIVSATVVATSVTRNGELTLLVLWRGSPGWFARGERGNGAGETISAGRSGESSWHWISYGGLTFAIELDFDAHTVRVLNRNISLIDTNVVLVDHVDS